MCPLQSTKRGQAYAGLETGVIGFRRCQGTLDGKHNSRMVESNVVADDVSQLSGSVPAGGN